jgi:isoamylase
MPFMAAEDTISAEEADLDTTESRQRAHERLLRAVPGEFVVRRGHPLPYGAVARRNGVNFSVFSHNATGVTLVLFLAGEDEPVLELPLDPRYNRTGDVWHAFVTGLDPGIEYGYRLHRTPNPDPKIHRYDPAKVLIDPFGKGLVGLETWGGGEGQYGRMERLRSRVVDEEFDWGLEQPLNVPLADSIIYEIHVRGLTRHPSSEAEHPGTFRGVTEKIPYLKELGVTAVELMPVTEFEESDNTRRNLLTGEPLRNFWGYQPISFFAPKASYAGNGGSAGAVREFKEMVKALHEAGIEVILDMVFNHTGEGDHTGPTFCYRGVDNAIYYLIDPKTGRYLNYSGCGNTLNCNHPSVRFMILTALRYWVTEMHVDGFRFDLASILGRGRNGEVLPNPPLLEVIASDPVMADVKLIAEAWDAAGLYQVGSFPSWGRWAEWNGKFRDEVRRFVKGDGGMTSLLATRLSGSPDLYQTSGREPWHSINFLTSHDGFTLQDLVSYNEKHNWENGEANTDGHDDNLSWNCGEEGPSSNPEVVALRRRQARNFMTLLLVSQGVPMIQGGDELGRTQLGNNNAYCLDNEVSWLDWRLREKNADFLRFVSRLIRFRKAHPSLRRRTFFEDAGAGPPVVAWHGTRLGKPDWGGDSRGLAMHLLANDGDDDIYLVANAHWEPHAFELPRLPPGRSWWRFVDTSREPPEDAAEPGAEAVMSSQRSYRVGPRSTVVLVGR